MLAKDPHHLIGVRILQIALGAMLLFSYWQPFHLRVLWAACMGPSLRIYFGADPGLGPMLGDISNRVFARMLVSSAYYSF